MPAVRLKTDYLRRRFIPEGENPVRSGVRREAVSEPIVRSDLRGVEVQAQMHGGSASRLGAAAVSCRIRGRQL